MSVLISEVEHLYRGVVTEPGLWSPQAVADWMEGTVTLDEIDQVTAKHLRHIVTMADKLRTFWSTDPRVGSGRIAWESRVDLAYGPRAWRPVLDLAEHLFELRPTPELFGIVVTLFRIVNHRTWLDGMTYEEWSAQSHED